MKELTNILLLACLWGPALACVTPTEPTSAQEKENETAMPVEASGASPELSELVDGARRSYQDLFGDLAQRLPPDSSHPDRRLAAWTRQVHQIRKYLASHFASIEEVPPARSTRSIWLALWSKLGESQDADLALSVEMVSIVQKELKIFGTLRRAESVEELRSIVASLDSLEKTEVSAMRGGTAEKAGYHPYSIRAGVRRAEGKLEKLDRESRPLRWPAPRSEKPAIDSERYRGQERNLARELSAVIPMLRRADALDGAFLDPEGDPDRFFGDAAKAAGIPESQITLSSVRERPNRRDLYTQVSWTLTMTDAPTSRMHALMAELECSSFRGVVLELSLKRQRGGKDRDDTWHVHLRFGYRVPGILR